MTLRDLDPSDDRPVYRRIADALREAIESGELAPGDKLPSETELMIVTEGTGWAPLYEYNVYVPNSEVVDGVV